MERKWMYGLNISDSEYVNGVQSFLIAAESDRVAKGNIEIFCPCSQCKNFVPYDDIKAIEYHLLKYGFVRNYTCWSEHGESLVDNSTSSHVLNANENNESYINDRHGNLNEMLHDLDANDGDINQEDLQQLFEDAEKPVYDGCDFSILSAVLELLKLKASSSWSDTSFTKLLDFMHRLLPKNNNLPISTYQAKKIMCPMGLEIERIHACPNDCMLYRDEYKNLHACVTCETSRYKKEPAEIDDDVTKNGPPAKLLWYFPIIPRLKRLFENKKEAKLLRWHFDQRKDDGKLRHVADSPQWRKINNKFPEFAKEIRNIRFGLSSDGINPFGNMSSRYSTWPVLLCMYNLPPWLCMKRKYIMMSLLISGPKQPGNDIDVYLSPLINDMKTLWKPGVEMYDAYMKEKFRLHAMIFCTINDFPAYGNLSGYSTKGKQACPICEDETSSRWLDNCKKTVFMGHRRSLPSNHPYRGMSSEFDVHTEYGREKGVKLNKERGKKVNFWELEYWKDLEVRHCIDVMHIEKNVCDSLLGLLLNIPRKTKDGINARKDMVSWGIRLELSPVENDKKRTYLPPAYYTMSKAEKTQFCKSLHDIKVPSSYSANIRSLVSMKDCKLQGMKSHDCHVLMAHMIPIAIRGLLPKHVRHSITKLCLFFNMIHSKVIDPEVLDSWQREIIVTLCELEMYFPPSFFDAMVHLVSHIVGEIKALGPIHLHYMFPFERYMGVVKGYVRNRSRPEGSIVEGYASEEVIDFYTNYLEGVKGIGVPQSRHVGRLHGVGTVGSKHSSPDQKIFEIAHFVVLEHMTCVAPYIQEHMKMLRAKNIGRTETWYTKRHNEQFATWLKDKVASNMGQPNVDRIVERLGEGPKLLVKTYQGYEINGYTFYTKMKDEKSTVQNSGVTVIASTGITKKSYYGVIQEIWELDYYTFKIPLFMCKWVNNSSGVKVDDYGFTLVDLGTDGYTSEPFILAKQAT
ncbi:uncharacterized protein Tco_0665245 [Tanacetum coccineum]